MALSLPKGRLVAAREDGLSTSCPGPGVGSQWSAQLWPAAAFFFMLQFTLSTTLCIYRSGHFLLYIDKSIAAELVEVCMSSAVSGRRKGCSAVLLMWIYWAASEHFVKVDMLEARKWASVRIWVSLTRAKLWRLDDWVRPYPKLKLLLGVQGLQWSATIKSGPWN